MDQNHDTSLLIEAIHDGNELPIDAAVRRQQTERNSEVVFVAPRKVQLNPANTRDLDANPAATAALRESIRLHGQQVACIGRRLEDHGIELIAGKRRWLAVYQLCETGFDIGLMIEVRRMNDDEAYRLIEAENSERKNMTPLEQGRFYEYMVERYGDATTIARMLGKSDAAISRMRDVVAAAAILGDQITDPNHISARQASSFMVAWRSPEENATLAAAIRSCEQMPAVTLFKFLAEQVGARRPPKGTIVTTTEGAPLGRILKTKTGGLRLELDVAADAVELPALVARIQAAISEFRRS